MLRELEGAMDALSLRQKTVARNLANVNTPGFTRSDVDFFQQMQRLFRGEAEAPVATEDTTTPERLDGNNVTLEQEMYALSQSEILYNAAARFASGDLARLRYAITEGRG